MLNLIFCRFFIFNNRLADGRRLAEMILFHGHTATPITCIFHGGQFILAHMRVFCFVRSAKTTIFRLATGITQMPGRIRNRTTNFYRYKP